MTSPYQRRPPDVPSPGAPPSPRRKASVVCSQCGHESPLDGDWQVRPDSDRGRTTIVCPSCGGVVTDQYPLAIARANADGAACDRESAATVDGSEPSSSRDERPAVPGPIRAAVTTASAWLRFGTRSVRTLATWPSLRTARRQ